MGFTKRQWIVSHVTIYFTVGFDMLMRSFELYWIAPSGCGGSIGRLAFYPLHIVGYEYSHSQEVPKCCTYNCTWSNHECYVIFIYYIYIVPLCITFQTIEFVLNSSFCSKNLKPWTHWLLRDVAISHEMHKIVILDVGLNTSNPIQ